LNFAAGVFGAVVPVLDPLLELELEPPIVSQPATSTPPHKTRAAEAALLNARM
jgi:hypothetical protein